MSISFKKVLLTGASGALGTVLRNGLQGQIKSIRLSDIAPLKDQHPNEEFIHCDLADKKQVNALVSGCDAIVHFGGVSTEHPFEQVLQANIRGVFHIYEAARLNGVKRVVFASSNHAIGFHSVDQVIDADCLQMPDSNYGMSKAYGENMARFYFDRYGIESVCLRIGSSFPEPIDLRMLITWLSYRDLIELVRCSLAAQKVDFTIVYGVSDNRDKWWDNSKAAHLGYVPQDNTEAFRARLQALPQIAKSDPKTKFQGGGYVSMGPWD
jgi:uronate dehydrogenase